MSLRPHVIRTQSDDATTVEFWCGSAAPTGPQATVASAPPSVRAALCPDCLAALAFATGDEPRHTAQTEQWGIREQRIKQPRSPARTRTG